MRLPLVGLPSMVRRRVPRRRVVLLRPPAAGAAAHPCLLEQLELADRDNFGRARACAFVLRVRSSAASKELISGAIPAFRLDFSSVQHDRAAKHDATHSGRHKRTSRFSTAKLDGSRRTGGLTDSSTQGSSDEARGTERQRSGDQALDHAMMMCWTSGSAEAHSIDMSESYCV